MGAEEVDRRWRMTQLSERSLEIAKTVLVEGLTYSEAGARFGVSKQYVGKVVRRIARLDTE